VLGGESGALEGPRRPCDVSRTSVRYSRRVTAR
jgi:hypothetical protein